VTTRRRRPTIPTPKAKPRPRDAFTLKQRRFIAEYLVDGNATQAAIRAGYSKKTAHAIGFENLRKPEVAAAVETAQENLQEKLTIEAADIARELQRCGFANMQDFMSVGADGTPTLDWSKLSRSQAAALAQVTVDSYMDGGGKAAREVKSVKFRLVDKRAALVDLAKLLGFWKDKHEHEVRFDHAGFLEQIAKERAGRE
jgi:phage terminase small subunit